MSVSLTSKEVAARFRITPGTLANWRGKGKGPKWYKLHDKAQAPVRYRLADVEKYEQERTAV